MVRILLLLLATYSYDAFATSYLPVTKVYHVTSDIELLGIALGEYKAKQGGYPNSVKGLKPLVQEGLLKNIPSDPWGRPYLYKSDGNISEVWSYGKDGVTGGDGSNFDFSSRTQEENSKNTNMVFQEYHGRPYGIIILSVCSVFLVIIVVGYRRRVKSKIEKQI